MLAYCLRSFSDKIALHISNEDTMFLVLGICGQAKKHWKHIEISRFKNVFEFANTHFCFLGSKFSFRQNVSRSSKQGNIDRKHINVSATMFPSLICLGFYKLCKTLNNLRRFPLPLY